MLGFVVAALAPLLVLADVTVPVKNHWSGSFQGDICFTITEELQSWKIHVMFDQPVTSMEIWSAEVEHTNDDKTEYVLVNKGYNGVEHVGDQLCINFIGHGADDINPSITAMMEGVDGGGTFTKTLQPNIRPLQTQASLPPGVTRPTTASTTPMNVPDGEGISAPMTIKNDWANEGRFEGWLDFDITEPTLGWIMKIDFSKPVAKMNVRQADVLSHNADGTEWILVNNDDKLFMQPGDHFQLRFEANLASPGSAPSATALLVNMGKDNYTVTAPDNTIGSKYNLQEVLMKSILFYEAQRSGKLPANNRIPWRGDSAMQDGSDAGVDLTGGWYDAGDFVKFNFPMAWATVVLEWGLLEFQDAYDSANQKEWMYESIKWPLDYLLKCHVADDVLYAQVGNPSADHGSWGRPEDLTMARPSFKITASSPGSDLAMETASAFAAGYLLFKDRDSTYADTLLQHAKSLWEFAINHPGKYSQSVSAANGFYSSFNYTDEQCWGSLWLYKATREQKYLDTAKQYYDPSPDWGMSWDDVIIGNQVLMYNLTGDAQYLPAIEGTFTDWFPGGSIRYTPKGLAWRLEWGSLRYASNMAMAALMAAHYGVHPDEYRHWAMCQIYYALGDTGRSFVVGFGQNPPEQPHHRASSCPNPPALCNMNVLHLDIPNTHVLYGALVGGPGNGDNYQDSRNNYVNNEVANDYNAGFQTAVAGLIHLFLNGENPEDLGSCPYHS